MSSETVTQSGTLSMANQSVDSPAYPTSRRGVRALFVLGALLSGGVALLGAAMWLFEGLGDGGGYNSKSSALIACVHVGLSLLGLVATTWVARWFVSKRVTGFMAGGYVFVTGVIYLELLAGVFYPREPAKRTPYESAPKVSWRLQSNYRGMYAGVPLETNGLGFRSPPLSEHVDDRTVRVVCLGDSITFGHAVEADYAYPQQLARLLRSRYPERDWQVVNTGVPGYCTFQETEQLKRCLANGFRPGLVVLLFCLNDVTEKYVALKQFGGAGLGYQRVADGTGGGLFRAMVWLRQYSSLMTAVTPNRVEAERRQAYRVRRLWMEPDAPYIQHAWTQAERELDELVQLCNKEDIGLLLAVSPFRQQFASEEETSAPQRRLAKFARSREVAFVNMLPGLQEEAALAHRSPESYFLDRPHMNAAGNRAMAEIMADQFRPLDATGGRGHQRLATGDRREATNSITSWQKVLARKLTE